MTLSPRLIVPGEWRILCVCVQCGVFVCVQCGVRVTHSPMAVLGVSDPKVFVIIIKKLEHQTVRWPSVCRGCDA